jgi:large subunit ribosomal protein LP0
MIASSKLFYLISFAFAVILGRVLLGDVEDIDSKTVLTKRSIGIHSDKIDNSAFLSLIPLLVGNVGLIFTKGDLKEVSGDVPK